MEPSLLVRMWPWRGGPTFQELALAWLEFESRRLVCPANERRHIEHLRPLWDKDEKQLRPGLVQDTLQGLSERLGPSTINKVHSTGRRIIRHAILRDRWAGTNPFDVVDRVDEPQSIMRSLTLAEARAVLPHLRRDRRTEALVMLYVGLRPGELKGLRKEDVDLAEGGIVVRRSHARNSTKTGKVREMPLPEGLWPYLEDAIRSNPGPLVFPGPAGGLQRHDVKMSRVLHTALCEAGLVTGWTLICRRPGCGWRGESRTGEGRCPVCSMVLWPKGHPIPVRWYDLRHSAATLHREAGADALAVQLMMGHAPRSVTDKWYSHLSKEYVRGELNKLKI